MEIQVLTLASVLPARRNENDDALAVDGDVILATKRDLSSVFYPVSRALYRAQIKCI